MRRKKREERENEWGERELEEREVKRGRESK